jgi:hypothetical protein
MVPDSLSLPLQEARNSHDCDTKGPSVGFVPDPSTGSIPLDAPGKGGRSNDLLYFHTYSDFHSSTVTARTGAVWSIDNGGMDQ